MTAEHADERFWEQHTLLCIVALLVFGAGVFVWPYLQHAIELSRRLP